MHISEMMEVLKDLDETSKRKVDILEHFVVSLDIVIDLLQLNLSITATQWRSKKWSLKAGDLYIEGPSSAGHFIYILSYKIFPFRSIIKRIVITT